MLGRAPVLFTNDTSTWDVGPVSFR